MHRSLGIHIGHHASCAVVVDGHLVSAVQQERITRRKHDGLDVLTNAVPIEACLSAVGLRIEDLDAIVTSFQALSPGGVGLGKPIVSRDFSAFDVYDPRHTVISHHQAHAISAVGSAGWSEGTAVVVDLAGSTTPAGGDFSMPFAEFERFLTTLNDAPQEKTECVSIYDVKPDGMTLVDREFCVPHNAPETFVHSAASLYDNVARAIFGSENAHGQLMALASVESGVVGEISEDDILTVTGDRVVFHNDWQHRVRLGAGALENAAIARVVQAALQRALFTYVRRARALTSGRDLALAGGTFLNILSNTEIAESALFERVFVPSSPHDAGISVGCAFFGWRNGQKRAATASQAVDRLGPALDGNEVAAAIQSWQPFVRAKKADVGEIVERLAEGQIVARCVGRSEFGPRALGGRSLLASPLPERVKDRLNTIKGRQSWRPVAPIILQERTEEFFVGPTNSPFMNFVHWIRPEHRSALTALHHPDGSTRAQTLRRKDDGELYDIIESFAARTGFPVLVNTSLNRAGEPIVQTAAQALALFMDKSDVDAIIIDDQLITRTPVRDAAAEGGRIRMAPGAAISVITNPPGDRHFLLLASDGRNCEVPAMLGRMLMEEGQEISETSVLYDESGNLHPGVVHGITKRLLLSERVTARA